MPYDDPPLVEPLVDQGAADRALAARGTAWLGVNNWLAKGIQALTLLVVAREFSPKDVGVFSAAVLIITVVAVPGIGFSAALTYRHSRVKEAARTALTISLLLGAAMTAAAWALAPSLARFFHTPDATGILRAMTSVIICFTAADIPMTLLDKELNYRRRFVPDVVSAVIGGILSIGLVLAHFGLAGLVTGQITQAVVMVVLYFTIGARVRPGWNRVLAGELVSYGWKTSAAAILQIVVLNIDYVIVGRVLGTRLLGFYSLAFRLCFFPYLVLTNVITAVSFPYYCRLPRKDIGPESAKVSAAIVLLTLPIFTGVFLMAGRIVLLGNRWAPAVGDVRALAVYSLFFSLSDSAMASLRALGRPGLTLVARILHLLVLGGLILLTVRRGITAVGIDQAVVAVSLAMFCMVLVWRESHFGLSAAGRFLLPAAGGAVATILVVVVAQRLVPSLGNPASFVGAVVLSLAGGLAYLGVAGSLGRHALREALGEIRTMRSPAATPPPDAQGAERGN